MLSRMPFRSPVALNHPSLVITLTLTMLLFASARAQHRRMSHDAVPAASGQQHEHSQAEPSLCDCPFGT